MKKKNLILVAFATILFASCAEEQQFGGAASDSKIGLNPTIGKVNTRATETTTANLNSFQAYSFVTDDNVNYMDGVRYTNASGQWNTTGGSFYWPVKGDLNFYCYAPATPGESGTFAINPSTQKLNGFSPYATAATQQDLIYAKATGSLAANATSGLDVNFKHALSEITIAAKNTNTAYTVEVSGVKVGNVISKGDFTFPTVSGADAAWSLASEKSDYTTQWQNATTLSATVSSLDASNTAFMLIPQQLSAQTKAIDGNYIALKVKITMQGGQVIHDGWTYVAMPTLWEMNKHYAYTLDFSSGAGQDENGNDIISGSQIKLNVTVTPWDEEYVTYPRIFISGENYKNYNEMFLRLNDNFYTIKTDQNYKWKFDVTDLDVYDIKFNSIHCRSLDLSNLNITTTKNLKYIFGSCKSFETLNVRGWDTSNVENMENMFSSCSSLTALDLSGWNTDNVTSMYAMFSGCSALTALDLSHFETGNVTNMSKMFRECRNLRTLNVPMWHTSKVTDMSYTFNYCDSLKLLDVSKLDTRNVTDMELMFEHCSSLQLLDVSNFNTNNVTNMSGMFLNCNSLTSLDVSKFNTSNVTDMDWMFSGCNLLTSLDVSKFNTSKVTNMDGMFKNCGSLTSLDVSHFDTSNVKNMNEMFSNCNSLTSLDVSNFNTNNVTDMGDMFFNCNLLTSLDVSKFNTSKVTDMGAMFRACSSLKTLDVSNFNTNKVTRTMYMFYGCKSLTSIDLSGWELSKTRTILRMFTGCNNLKTIYMVGCNETTINKIKTALTEAGLSTDIIKTTKE